MRALQIERFGSLDEIVIRDVPEAPLAEGEVRIEVEAAAVNPSDVGIVLGRFPQATLPRVMGRDFAGTVVEGPKELVGAEVWGSGGGELGLTRDGAHAASLTIPAGAVARRAAHLAADQAASMGVPFITAWSALMDLAAIQPDECAIVSGAAGAVGSAAVQLVTAIGAKAIALVTEGTDLTPLVGLNVAAVAYSERNELPAVTNRVTHGRGADVALNAVGAPVFDALVASLAKDGRMVIFSAAGGRTVQLDLFAFYRGRFRFYGLDTAAFPLTDIARILDHLSPLIESQKLKPPVVAEHYPLSRAKEAYERVHNGVPGKVVIVPD